MPLRKDDPKSVGGYRLLDRLGAGGMGAVYRGRSRSGREVAVKVVHAQYAEDPVFRTRFRQEIEAVRKVSGAFTAPVVDADPEAVRPWMATQYVAGPSLAERIRDGGELRGGELRQLALGLVEALRDIHRAGVVHRDLKPANVLMAEDGPRVIDFGISRAAENHHTLTETGQMIGTPPFMSPEQLTDARTVGPASDVFSLGALLVYAATGRGPFDADSPYMTAYRVVHDKPVLDGIGQPFQGILERCLTKEAADRPGLDELARELAAALPEQAPGESPAPAARRPASEPTRPPDAEEPPPVDEASARRRTRLLALTAAVGVLVVALTAYLLLGPLKSGGTTTAGRSPSPSDTSRWAALPDGWQPWRTTVYAPAAGGVTAAPDRFGGRGTPSCALSEAALYCTGPGVLPVRLDALTGRTLWRSDILPAGRIVKEYQGIMLGVHGGVVVLRQSANLLSGDKGAPSVVALDAATGRRLWSRPMGQGYVTPALAAGLALIPDGAGKVTARSLRDGNRHWSTSLPADHACVFHEAEDDLYVRCSRWDGDAPAMRLLALDPADGTTRQVATLGVRTTYLGSLGDRLVFVEESDADTDGSGDTSYTHAVLVDRESGAARKVKLADSPGGTAALVNGVLCFAASNGLVVAVSPETGDGLWRTRTTLEQPGRPLADGRGRTVFLATPSGRVAALDTRRGTVLWESLPRADRAGSDWAPEVFRAEGALMVATPDGTVFSLDPAHPDRNPVSG